MENEAKPIRYVIQDKHFALNDKFVISDESGQICYRVDSTLFSAGEKLILSDADGNELIKIRQEILHLHPTYIIDSIRHDVDEMQLASIKRTGAPWNHKLEINAKNGEYRMEKKDGIFSHEFILKKEEAIVAIVTKDPSPLTSVYYVDVASDREEYRAFLVSMVIVLACAQRLPSNPLTTGYADDVKDHTI